MLNVPKNIINKMILLAEKEAPIETCGYLAGEKLNVKEIYPMKNIDNSPEHFSFDPAEQFKVVKEARRKRHKLIAIYHGHPKTSARLSDEDKRLANDPNIFYLIISLANKDPEIKAYNIIEDKVSEIKINIIEVSQVKKD